MYYDVAGSDRLVGAVVVYIVLSGGIFPPNADAEGVGAVGAFAVTGPQLKLVGIAVGVGGPVDQAAALELGVRPVLVHDQPLVGLRVEAEAGDAEPELRGAGGHSGALLVLGDKAEGRLAGQARIRQIGSCGRADPAAAGDEAGAGVVDDRQGAGRFGVERAVVDRQAHIVDPGSCVGMNGCAA